MGPYDGAQALTAHLNPAKAENKLKAETLTGLSLFSIATSITPGPNNLMLLTSGANFGFRRTAPHALGIAAGFFILLFAVGLGLGSALTAFPGVHLALKILGGAYMLYLAWGVASSRSFGEKKGVGARPMTVFEAALFQWVNPKAWVMALTGMALFADPARPFWSMLIVCVVFAALNLPCVSVWAAFGVGLRRFLSGAARLKWFNVAMGALLAASIIPLLA